jgi:hypothetical protein
VGGAFKNGAECVEVTSGCFPCTVLPGLAPSLPLWHVGPLSFSVASPNARRGENERMATGEEIDRVHKMTAFIIQKEEEGREGIRALGIA